MCVRPVYAQALGGRVLVYALTEHDGDPCLYCGRSITVWEAWPDDDDFCEFDLCVLSIEQGDALLDACDAWDGAYGGIDPLVIHTQFFAHELAAALATARALP